MPLTQLRPALGLVALTAGLTALMPLGPTTAQDPAGRILLSQLPVPKAGEKVQVGVADIKSKEAEGEPGFTEVTEILEPALGADDYRTIPAVEWELDVDGWFDDEGLNLTAIYPRSGLWALRGLGGKAEPKQTAAGPLRPESRYARPGDIVTHLGGVAVKSYDRWVYAINAAPNKRDISLVLMDGRTGKKRLLHVSANKIPAR